MLCFEQILFIFTTKATDQNIYPPLKQKFDLKVENLDRYFALTIDALTDTEKERIPLPIYSRLFRRNGTMSTKPFSFLQMVYILSIAAGKDIYMAIEGPEGMSIAGYERFKKQQKAGIVDEEQAEYYLSRGTFVLSSKDLVGYMNQVNRSSISPILNYMLKLKNTKGKKFESHKTQTQAMVDMLVAYESNKSKMAQVGFDPSDILVLLYLYDGGLKTSKGTYDKVFKGTPMANRVNIINAYKKLSLSGHVEVIGRNAATKYRITALGSSAMNEIIKKYILP